MLQKESNNSEHVLYLDFNSATSKHYPLEEPQHHDQDKGKSNGYTEKPCKGQKKQPAQCACITPRSHKTQQLHNARNSHITTVRTI